VVWIVVVVYVSIGPLIHVLLSLGFFYFKFAKFYSVGIDWLFSIRLFVIKRHSN
jgi:hypothetical protein